MREASATVSRVRTALDRASGEPAIAQAVASARSGDRQAIAVLYARYEENIYSYVLSMIRDRHEADDVTRQVFLRVMSVVHEFEPSQAPFTSWLLRVTHDVAVDHLHQRHFVPREEEVYEPLQQADDSARERPSEREQAPEVIGEEQPNVTVLRHLIGLTPVEQDQLMDSDHAPAARAAAS
jgi:RNA polymerase sigma-70 factor (ECF subfamily)